MCNMNDNIQNAVDFYRQFTGKQLEAKRALPELTKQLPVMITELYSIYVTEIMGMPYSWGPAYYNYVHLSF